MLMIKLLLRIGAALVGFAVGWGVFQIWQSQRPAIPYCEVAQNAEWYHNRNIRVRARMIFGSDGTYVFENCDPVEALAAVVELPGSVRSNSRNYVEEVLVTGEKAGIKSVEAIIEGRFDAKNSPGCWAPKFRITASEIEFVSEPTAYEVAFD
jgi:hypothetical protein